MTIMMDFSPSFLSLLVFQDHVSFYSHDQLEIHYVDEAVLEKKVSLLPLPLLFFFLSLYFSLILNSYPLIRK